MLQDFVDQVEAAGGITGYAVFYDDRAIQVRAPDPTAFYEAFVAVQRITDQLADDVMAAGLVEARFSGIDDQYLFRVFSSEEGRVSAAFQAASVVDLAGLVGHLSDEAAGPAGLGVGAGPGAEPQPPPPTAADAVTTSNP